LLCTFLPTAFLLKSSPEQIRTAYFQIHIAIILWGFTAILGDLISLSAIVLVWWRVLLTTISLLFLIDAGKLLRRLPPKTLLQFFGIGVLIAVHWITFFGAVKLANASIALICMATTSLFTSFLEPIFTDRPFRLYELVLSLFIIPGMWLIVDSTEVTMMWGIAVGLSSAFLVSLFSIFTKKLIDTAGPYEITFLQISSATIFLSFLLPIYFYLTPEAAFLPAGCDWTSLFTYGGELKSFLWKWLRCDWVGLIILALVCTTYAYTLSIKAYNHLSAFAINLTVNLEPVYGIAIAWFILTDSDELSPDFYWGVLVILITVFSYPVFRNFFGKKSIE